MIKDLGNGKIHCYLIDGICPYSWDCIECEVFIANSNMEEVTEKAKALSETLQNQTEQEKYDDYHADDHKRRIEDKMVLGD